jgi:hypothetical protein
MMRWRIRERIGEGERGSSKGTKVAARGGNCRYEEQAISWTARSVMSGELWKECGWT